MYAFFVSKIVNPPIEMTNLFVGGNISFSMDDYVGVKQDFHKKPLSNKNTRRQRARRRAKQQVRNGIE
jgi:hypothetical protein